MRGRGAPVNAYGSNPSDQAQDGEEEEEDYIWAKIGMHFVTCESLLWTGGNE